jgi:hypothetical protein
VSSNNVRPNHPGNPAKREVKVLQDRSAIGYNTANIQLVKVLPMILTSEKEFLTT